MRFVAIAAFACAALSPLTLHADGVIVRLPDEGAWVRYDLKASTEDAARTEQLTVTMSSVGTLTVENDKCRWIELVYEHRSGVAIIKLLIPEKAFKPGENPLTSVVRGWVKVGDKKAEARKDFANGGELLYFLTPPLSDLKDCEKKRISFGNDVLDCNGRVGHFRLADGQAKMDVAYHFWLNDKVPFGVAAVETQEALDTGGESKKVTTKITLNAFGKDGQSKLPDLQ